MNKSISILKKELEELNKFIEVCDVSFLIDYALEQKKKIIFELKKRDVAY